MTIGTRRTGIAWPLMRSWATNCSETDIAFCGGFRMPAAHGAASNSGGRRPKASNGGNRGKGYEGRAAGSMGICL
jgi:hypothetical protein